MSRTKEREAVELGRATRLRRRGAAVVLGAAVGIGLVGGAVVTARPSPDAPEPAVRSLSVWADGAGIHVGRRTYPAAGRGRGKSLALVAGGVVYADARGHVWFQPTSGAAARIGRADRGPLSAGALGDTAAWIETVDRTAHLVLFDTGAMEETARVEVAGKPAQDMPISGDRVANTGPFLHVDDDAVVYVTFRRSLLTVVRQEVASGEQTALHQGDDAYLLLDVAGPVSVWASPVDGIGSEPYFRRTLTFEGPDGEPTSTERAEPTGVLSADGTRFAGVFPSGGTSTYVGVVDAESGEVLRMTGDSRLYPLLAWGADDTLMVRRVRITPGPRFAELLACEADQPMSCSALRARGRTVLPTS